MLAAMGLRDKVAVVTGASRGIGKATAVELARHGADVVVTARTVDEPGPLPGTLAETVAEIEALGRRAVAVRCNVGKQEDLDALVEQTVAAFGRIDVLINNAAFVGAAAGKGARELSRKEWDLIFSVNISAPYWLTMGFRPHFSPDGGTVVNVTSVAAEHRPVGVGSPGNPAYGPTKAALNRVSNLLATELLTERIAVVALDPGLVFSATIEAMTPAGRGMPPGHVSTAVPATAIAHIAALDDPMLLTGDVVDGVELVRRLGLLETGL